jgi:hypothetical protein
MVKSLLMTFCARKKEHGTPVWPQDALSFDFQDTDAN